MSLVVAGVYIGILFSVGMAFVVRHRSSPASNCVRKEPVPSQKRENARSGKKDRREVAMASVR